jgi:hypothetical protein
MLCKKRDELDAEFCAIRTRRSLLFSQGKVTSELQEELDWEEQAKHVAIMDHKMFAHWPTPCLGD